MGVGGGPSVGLVVELLEELDELVELELELDELMEPPSPSPVPNAAGARPEDDDQAHDQRADAPPPTAPRHGALLGLRLARTCRRGIPQLT